MLTSAQAAPIALSAMEESRLPQRALSGSAGGWQAWAREGPGAPNGRSRRAVSPARPLGPAVACGEPGAGVLSRSRERGRAGTGVSSGHLCRRAGGRGEVAGAGALRGWGGGGWSRVTGDPGGRGAEAEDPAGVGASRGPRSPGSSHSPDTGADCGVAGFPLRTTGRRGRPLRGREAAGEKSGSRAGRLPRGRGPALQCPVGPPAAGSGCRLRLPEVSRSSEEGRKACTGGVCVFPGNVCLYFYLFSYFTSLHASRITFQVIVNP